MNIEEIIDKKGFISILKFLFVKKRCSYTEIKKNCNLNPQTLSRRLKEFQEFGIIKRDVKEDRSVVYALTEKGRKIVNIFQKLEKL